MNRSEMLKRLDLYLDGSMRGRERLEFEMFAEGDSVVRDALHRARRLESLLQNQIWLTPSDGFTQAVLARVGLSPAFEADLAPVSRRELWLDWLQQALAPAAAIVVFAVMFGRTLVDQGMGYLQGGARALDAMIGTQVFSSHPLILVGVAAPLLGILIISATVTRRLRLAS